MSRETPDVRLKLWNALKLGRIKAVSWETIFCREVREPQLTNAPGTEVSKAVGGIAAGT